MDFEFLTNEKGKQLLHSNGHLYWQEKTNHIGDAFTSKKGETARQHHDVEVARISMHM